MSIFNSIANQQKTKYLSSNQNHFQKSLSIQSTLTTPKKEQTPEKIFISSSQQYLKMFVSQNLAKEQSHQKSKMNQLQNKIKILEARISQLQDKNFELTQNYLTQQEKFEKNIRKLNLQNDILKNKLKATTKSLAIQSSIRQQKIFTNQKQFKTSLNDILEPFQNLKQVQNSFVLKSFQNEDHNQHFSCLNSIQTIKHLPNKNICEFKAYIILQKENQQLKKMLRRMIFDKNSNKSPIKNSEIKNGYKTPQKQYNKLNTHR